MRYFLTFQALVLAVLFCGCAATGPYVEKESDRLTEREKHHLFDYSRHFIISTVITKPAQKEAEERRLGKKNKREVKQKDLTPQEKDELKIWYSSVEVDEFSFIFIFEYGFKLIF